MKELRISVGIIPDGNRRYAKKLLQNPEEGYGPGAEAIKKIIRRAFDLNVIGNMVIYLLSKDNVRKRPPEQVRAILDASEDVLRFCSSLKDVGITFIGDQTMSEIKGFHDNYGRQGEKMNLFFLTNYSPEWDRGVCYAYSSRVPELDLVIRTSGDQGLSGFVPHRCGYARLFFPKSCWPDFRPDSFQAIINEYLTMGKRSNSGA